jgi:hypothetical protein
MLFCLDASIFSISREDSTIILDNDSNESYRANVSRKRKSRQFQDDKVVDDNHDTDDQKLDDNMTTRSKIIKLDDGASVDDEDLPNLNADQVYCNQIVDTNFDNQNNDASFGNYKLMALILPVYSKKKSNFLLNNQHTVCASTFCEPNQKFATIHIPWSVLYEAINFSEILNIQE